MIEGELRLSLEEAAVAVSIASQAADAEVLLRAELGRNVTREDVRSRLTAAGHSLLARSLLAIGDGRVLLREDLALAARALARPLWSLSYRRVTQVATLARAYHFTASAVYEHRLENGVVHCLRVIDDRGVAIKDAIDAGFQFFGLGAFAAEVVSPFDVPTEFVSRTANSVIDSEDLKRLIAGPNDEAVVNLFLSDLRDSVYRGTVLGVEYGPAAMARADQGFFILMGTERAWVLRPLSEGSTAITRVFSGSQGKFTEEVCRLVRVLDRSPRINEPPNPGSIGEAHPHA